MQRISRRELISSGLAVTASCLTTHLAWSQAIAADGDTLDATPVRAELAMAPREQLLFDSGWKFVFGDGNDPIKDVDFGFGQSDFSKTGEFAFAKDGFDDSKWRPLD